MNQENEVEYPIYKPTLLGNEKKYLINAFDSGWISSKGEYIKRFESKFAEFIGTEHSISCSNGTAALHLAVRALDIGKNDEVLVPNVTFASPANAVLYEGAKPVLVDIEKNYWNIDPTKLEDRITKRTKAIILVHLYGYPCDIDKITKIAESYDLKIIEDCAESLGAKYRNTRVGKFGEVSCFSFYGNKIMTTGEGGMVVTNNEQIADRIQKLRDHGMKEENRYWHAEVGYNYRMTNMQAAIGLGQLEQINNKIARKIEVANNYKKSLPKPFRLQTQMNWAHSVYWLVTVRMSNSEGFEFRETLLDSLRKKGVDTRPFFYPLSDMPPYYSRRNFEVSRLVSYNSFSLPSYETLKEDDIARISSILSSLYDGLKVDS